jgi:hypothetical protein
MVQAPLWFSGYSDWFLLIMYMAFPFPRRSLARRHRIFDQEQGQRLGPSARDG